VETPRSTSSAGTTSLPLRLIDPARLAGDV
jgi:hypothetical protein